MKEKAKKVIEFVRKYFLFLLPIFILIIIFIYFLYLASATEIDRLSMNQCLSNYNCEGTWSHAKGYAAPDSNCENCFHYIPSMSYYYKKIFSFQNIITTLLVLILYYGLIFGFGVMKKIENK
jgi:hypothetical protein